MNFTYEPNFRDNYHAALYGFWGTRARALRSALVCAMFGLFLFVFLRATGYSAVGALAAAAVGAVAWALVFSLGFSAWLARSLARRQRSLGTARISVTDEALERSTGSATLRVGWEAIGRVEETSRAFFLHDATRPVFAIEKSAVKSAQDLRALREFLRARKPGKYFHDAVAH